MDLPPFICVVALFKCSLCELQRGSLSASRNVSLLFNPSPRWGIVSPTDCLILEGQKGEAWIAAQEEEARVGCSMSSANLEPFLQFRVNWKYSVQVEKKSFIPREMNALDSKGINDSNVLIKKESRNVYFWKYGSWGVLLVGKERSAVGAENM